MVHNSGLGVEGDDVVDALPSGYKAVLGFVSIGSDDWGYGAVGNSCYGFVVGVFKLRGLVFSAERLTLLAVSSSNEPFGKNTPRMSLKSVGGASPLHMEERIMWRTKAPFSPAACQQAYGIPSGPGALCLTLRREVLMSLQVGRLMFEKSHGVQKLLAKMWVSLVLIFFLFEDLVPVFP